MHGCLESFDFNVIIPGSPPSWIPASESREGEYVYHVPYDPNNPPEDELNYSIYNRQVGKLAGVAKDVCVVEEDNLYSEMYPANECWVNNYDNRMCKWERENWGTKWNAYSIEEGHIFDKLPDGRPCVIVQFNTAWSQPDPIFYKLQEMGYGVHHNCLYEGGEGVYRCSDWDEVAAPIYAKHDIHVPSGYGCDGGVDTEDWNPCSEYEETGDCEHLEDKVTLEDHPETDEELENAKENYKSDLQFIQNLTQNSFSWLKGLGL